MKLAFAMPPVPGDTSVSANTRSLAVRCRFVASAVLLLSGFAYLCVCLFFVMHQRAFQYTLGGTRSTPEAAAAAGFTEVKVPTEDGERLDGWWLAPPAGRGVVLFLHGTPGTVPEHTWRFAQLKHSGLGILAIDWRGYGGSTGQPTELGVRADARAGFDFIRRAAPESRIAVTASGMSALMLAIEALIDPGDRVVCVTPLWPNLTEIPKILGATVARVPLSFGRDGWTLDLDRLLAALTPETRAVMINSPNNPSGWTIDRESQRTILEHCRERGIWIVADDVYERLFYASGACAPSFLDIATADDRLVSTNSFSKAWLMTGWRLGWIVAPTALMRDLGKLIEYNTSCSPAFVQRAGVVALERGESTVAHTLARFRAARDYLTAALDRIPGISAPAPADGRRGRPAGS